MVWNSSRAMGDFRRRFRYLRKQRPCGGCWMSACTAGANIRRARFTRENRPIPVPAQPRRGRDRLALYKRRGTEPERAVSRYCNAGFRARCRFSERRPSGAGIDRSADARHSDKRCKASGRPPCPGSSNAGCGRLPPLSDCGQRLAAAFLRPPRVHSETRTACSAHRLTRFPPSMKI